MNCRPGCIAYVAKLLPTGSDDDPTAKGFTDIRGTVVRCVRLVAEERWLLESPILVAWTVSGRKGFFAGWATVTAMGDQFLLPLDDPGDDAVDETLLRLPSPRQEVTA